MIFTHTCLIEKNDAQFKRTHVKRVFVVTIINTVFGALVEISENCVRFDFQK